MGHIPVSENPTRDNYTRNSHQQATQSKTDNNSTSKPETTIPVQLIKEREREGTNGRSFTPRVTGTMIVLVYQGN
jgi:hypothetical protein